MPLKLGLFSKLIHLLLLVLLLNACFPKWKATHKEGLHEIYSYLRLEGLKEATYFGKLFVEGEVDFIVNGARSGASYGNFYVNAERLIIQLTPPLGSETLIVWKKGLPEILIIDPTKKRGLRVSVPGDMLFDDFPLYFLGLKENRAWRLDKYSGEYTFDHDTLTGKLTSNLFKVTWKIKEIKGIEKLPELPAFDDYKIRTIFLTF